MEKKTFWGKEYVFTVLTFDEGENWFDLTNNNFPNIEPKILWEDVIVHDLRRIGGTEDEREIIGRAREKGYTIPSGRMSVSVKSFR